MKVEIFTVLKNAEYILPLYLKHYRECFPNCVINIFDNNSEDSGIALCREASCKIETFPIYNEPNLQYFKNNIWKNSKAKWVIVCDVDELLQINHIDLKELDCDIVQGLGYNMVDFKEVLYPDLMEYGVASRPYDKCILFKPSIENINYDMGAHDCHPKYVTYSKNKYKLLHYNKSWFNVQSFCNKHKLERTPEIENLYKDLKKNIERVK